MNVPTALEFDAAALAEFKKKVGRPSRLNIKTWVASLVSRELNTEVPVKLSENQKAKLKKDEGARKRSRKTGDTLNRPVSVVKGTTPTILQRKYDDEPKKKFSLRKK